LSPACFAKWDIIGPLETIEVGGNPRLHFSTGVLSRLSHARTRHSNCLPLSFCPLPVDFSLYVWKSLKWQTGQTPGARDERSGADVFAADDGARHALAQAAYPAQK